MKFLVDAQLPARLTRFLSSSGHDVLHTSELPDGNRTTDARIAEVADGSDRVVVTKDRDFRDSHPGPVSMPGEPVFGGLASTGDGDEWRLLCDDRPP